MNSFKYAIAGAALALTPVMAQAVTHLTGADGLVANDYDLLADSYDFNQAYEVGDGDETLTFNFTNNDASTAAVSFFGITVNQTNAAFSGGVDIDFGAYALDVDEGVVGGLPVSGGSTFFVAAGETVTLTIEYGTVFDLPPSFPGDAAQIDFQVQAALVPIPAAGLLLLTALGAAGALRRRKAAA